MTGWIPLTTQPTFSVDTMLLLTDGSIMCHEYQTANWHKLVPDAFGDYSKGSWHATKPMPNNAPTSQNGPGDAPLYFASAVLKDGRVFVAGGEYNGTSGVAVDLLAVSIYDPVADSWISAPNPPGWTQIGDAPTCVLPDGRVLLGNINAVGTVIYDPVSNSWSSGGDKHDTSSEETWTLLPNQTILVAEVNNHPQSERYVIATGKWIADSNIPAAADLVLNVPNASIEIGPAILMPNGKVFAAGASGHTAIYTHGPTTTASGTWVAGPDFPKDANGNLMRAFDAPATLLPSGHVLCVAGAVITSGVDAGWAGFPTNFFEFDGTSLHQIPSPPNASSTLTFNCRLLLLANGQVILSTCTNNLQIYQPTDNPDASSKPVIVSCPTNLAPGGNYSLNGKQLNGLSQACCYGDDAQMATNYPLVRIRNLTTQHLFYCRTHQHSTMGVATGAAIHSTQFVVPSNIENGQSELVVVANGIASAPVTVTVSPFADGAWIARHGLTSAQYQQTFNDLVGQGFRLVDVSGYGSSQALYAALWVKESSPPWEAHHGMTSAQYQTTFNTLVAQGYRLIEVNGYGIGGFPFFAAIWDKSPSPAWVARHNMTAAEYQQEFNLLVGQGYRLRHISGYANGSNTNFAAIWDKSSGPAWEAHHGVTAAQYQQTFNTLVGQGYRLIQVSGYSVGGVVNYAAIWDKSTVPAWQARHGLTAAQYQQTFNDLVSQGYRLAQVSGYTLGTTDEFAAIWVK